ncbi:DUF3995 domain-containing protein [Staphylococcus gallinarum]|uniref:DUF3995 domain-containing protein n=1 Tax=Staphylococcus gallinarum TaxID=1293 RepID=UPI001E3921F4|nr:DUF3995 domain-containing protein [Staphylococcus gallinarum]MCD8794868.1 DUF3995 domain-containing protein [Staphylococcus gallinarum]MDN6414965.1 DUF3995 domain-containing protein [Staphylococcus gallinarum]
MKRKTLLVKNIGLYLFLIAGSIHSLFTFYWTFGGNLGLITVGDWTIQFKQNYGTKFLIILLFVGIFKLTATWIPYILNFKENKLIIIISYIGGIILFIYGGLNMISGWLKLLGVIDVDFKLSIIGQAFIWDPLFLLWGLGILIFLNATRKLNY